MANSVWVPWSDKFRRIWRERFGLERYVGVVLLAFALVSLSELILWCAKKYNWGGKYNAGVSRIFRTFGLAERRVARIEAFVDGYVVAVLAFSIFAFLFPSHWLAWISAYFSFSTVVVLLNIVLLSKAFGEIASPERSVLLFMCNVAQIVFMFATWYHLCGQEKPCSCRANLCDDISCGQYTEAFDASNSNRFHSPCHFPNSFGGASWKEATFTA